ncbi:MAG TPA: MFS transporter [Candidatus Limnocylindrales bacterium]
MSIPTADPAEPPVITGRLGRLRGLRIWDAAGRRDFRLLWASEGISVLGDQFHAVALSWLVISLTGSGLALGTVLIAISVPRAILLLPMGVAADRRSPRSMMLVSHVARAAIVAAITALIVSDNASIPALAALGVVFGAADAMFIPAMQAFVPSAAGEDRLPSANALLQGTFQLTSIVGPPVAGLVVAAAGTGIAFGFDAASFVIAAGLLLMIGRARVLSRAGVRPSANTATDEAARASAATPVPAAPPTAPAPNEPFLASMWGGLRYVIADRAIAMLMLVSLVLNFALSGPASVGMPWLAELRYHAGAAGLGVLVAAWALGGLTGTLIAGNARLERQGRTVLVGLGVAGCAVAVVGIAPSVLVAFAAFAVGGLCTGYVNIVAVSWLQARVDRAMLGRVMGLVMLMGFGISPLSMAIAGALIDVNATALFLGAGALMVVTTIAAQALGMAELFNAPAGSAPARAARVGE